MQKEKGKGKTFFFLILVFIKKYYLLQTYLPSLLTIEQLLEN